MLMHVSRRTRDFLRALIGVHVVGAILLVAPSDAGAAFSGNTWLNVCGSSMISDPYFSDGGRYWAPTSDRCGITMTGSWAWAAGAVITGTIPMPLYRLNDTSNIQPVVRALGGDGTSASKAQVCATIFTYYEDGTPAAGGAWACTTGARTLQILQPSSWIVSLPGWGAAVFNITAQKGGSVATGEIGWFTGGYD